MRIEYRLKNGNVVLNKAFNTKKEAIKEAEFLIGNDDWHKFYKVIRIEEVRNDLLGS
jgi:hypothetical protein